MTLPEAGNFIATITTTSELRSAASHRRTLMPPHSPSGGASAMSRREVRKGHRSTQVNLPACPGRDWQPSCCRSSGQPPHGRRKRPTPRPRDVSQSVETRSEFALAVEQAEAKALGRVEAEIVNRAFTLDGRPIFDRQGKRIG